MKFNLQTHQVFLGDDYLSSFESVLDCKLSSFSKIYILTDSNTLEHCLPILLEEVPELQDSECIEIEPGEASKSLEVVNQIWSQLTENQSDRKTLWVNLGGGVVCDLGAFVASTYKRGLSFIQIPTSLLAQVDASVGSKTGINFNGFKNQIGTFTDPLAVFVAPKFLDTLSERQYKNGFAEIIKHALIADVSYWEAMKNGKHDMDYYIGESLKIKTEIVLADKFESSRRKQLNFGHSFAHAFETYASQEGLELFHGEAVALGMLAEAYLSMQYLGLKESEYQDIKSSIPKVYPIQNFRTHAHPKALAFIAQDKKNEHGKLNMTLLKHIGKAQENVEVLAKDLEPALESIFR
ncbi:MAG: 3-dehydroquinate synthase [Flavobacteriales bacterium]